MDILHQENVDLLFRAILSLKTPEECYAFFEDACTIKEIQEIAQRFEVASQLWQGRHQPVLRRQYGNHMPCQEVPFLRQQRLPDGFGAHLPKGGQSWLS